MAKIFDIDFRRGSLLEKVSNTVLAVNGSPLFKNSIKGRVYEMTGSNHALIKSNYTSWGGLSKFTLVFWGKVSSMSTISPIESILNGSNRTSLYFNNDSRLYVSVSNGSSGFGSIAYSDISNYHQFVMVFDGTQSTNATKLKLYIDGVQQTLLFGANITALSTYSGTTTLYINYSLSGAVYGKTSALKIEAYDTAFNELEINSDYQDFLNSKQIGKSINNFIKSKPTTLLENGLVAAYNMVRNGNTITDISGNGKDLTITNIVDQTTRGVRINGTGYLSRAYFLTSKATKSISFRVMVNSNSDQNVIFTNYDGTARQHIWIESGYVYHYVYDGASKYQVRAPLTSQPGVRTNITFTHDETNQIFKFYINGVDTTVSSTGAISIATSTGTAIGYDLRGTTLFKGEIEDVRIYNRILTQSEITDYHNQFVRPTLLETFANNGADNIAKGIRNWTIASGTWKINENTTNQTSGLKVGDKYLECITAGVISLPSKIAYGTWEFDLYKATSINLPRVYIISDKNRVGAENGYMLYSTTGAYIAINKLTNGGGSVLIGHNVTADITIANWYKVKITRSIDGTFTLLMKGGTLIPTLGYGGYTLILAEGGTTNPKLDNTFTLSNYFMLDIDAGDRIANIKILDGIVV